MVLKPSEVKKYYDWFGRKQDSQSFYEDEATDTLIAHGGFGKAARVFEFGCGTGRFAEKLLKAHLPLSATYTGCDLSSTMVGLAGQRLAAFSARARVVQSDGTIRFPMEHGSADRVVCTYVLDLMSEADIRVFFLEASRVLERGGKLGLVSLTEGGTTVSRFVTAVWASIFRMRAIWVGGCRPIRLTRFLMKDCWQLEFHRVVTAFGIPSEVLVAVAIK
jgi:ubiquinone/menaquinone biosynthesis C-methylase UbiE